MGPVKSGRRAAKWNRIMAATLFGCSACTAWTQEPESLPPLPPWDYTVTLASGAGYRDNVTLSHAAPEASSFFRGAAEAMLFNIDVDGPQYTFYGSADYRH